MKSRRGLRRQAGGKRLKQTNKKQKQQQWPHDDEGVHGEGWFKWFRLQHHATVQTDPLWVPVIEQADEQNENMHGVKWGK